MNKKILLLLLICFLLTGCYDYKELNTIAILSATSVDYQDNEYIVTAEAINPQAPDKTTIIQSPFIIYTGKGKTLQEAYRKITVTSSKFLYSNHLQILLLSENVAKEKLPEVLDFFSRNPSIRTEFNVLMYKSDNPLKIITPINVISSSSILDTMNTNTKYLGTSLMVTFNDLLNNYLNPHNEIVLPVIEVINQEETSDKNNKENVQTENKEDNKNEEKNKGDSLENTESSTVKETYKLSNIALFKNNKLKGYLTDKESIAFNYLKNNIKNTILTYECEPNKFLTLEIIDNKVKINNKFNTINISVNLTGNINESTCKKDINDIKNLKELEKDISLYFSKELTKNITNVQTKYNSDIFGFLDLIYKNDYNHYKKIKNNQNYFQDINIKVNSKVNIKSSGNIMEGINEKNK